MSDQVTSESVVTDETLPVQAESEVQPIEPVAQEQQPKAEEPPEEPPVSKVVQKRIDKAIRQRYEAEARAKMYEDRIRELESKTQQVQQQPKVDEMPLLQNFDSYDDYQRAIIDYSKKTAKQEAIAEIESRERAAKAMESHRTIAENWEKRLEQARKDLPDYEEVVSSASDMPITPLVKEAILESDIGPRLVYYFANNPEEYDRICSMQSEREVNRAIGRVEAKLESGTTPPVKVSNAPAPIKTVSGKPTVNVDPDKMSTQEWLKWRREQLVKKRA